MNGWHLLIAAAVVTMLWMLVIQPAIVDFIVQPRRDARGRRKHWCSGCDRDDVMEWDMGWTSDNGRWWCRQCRTGSALSL